MTKPIQRARIAAKAAALCLFGATAALHSDQPRAQTPPGACAVFGAGYYGLTADNVLFSFIEGETRAVRVTNVDGNLIGIDFRASDPVGKQLYGLTDTGRLYKLSLDLSGEPELVSSLSRQLSQGAMVDFDPTGSSPLRIMSGIQNLEVTNGAQQLDTVVAHKPAGFAPDDRNGRVRPHITAGAYNNNLRGSQFSRLYAIDSTLDVLTFEAYPSAGGSDELRTIGPLKDTSGRVINFAANAGFDIYTQRVFPINTAVLVNGNAIYCVHNVGVFDQSVPEVRNPQLVADQIEPPIHPLITTDLIDVAVIPLP